jgi:protein-S-isoprenylcysteine O-methyltransferase Ste14
VQRSAAAIGSSFFFAVAPGAVAGLGPWLITRWRLGAPWSHLAPLRVLGVLAVLAGGSVLVAAFVRFVVEGAGTPAPVAPPEHLVVGGLYRYVRNPMYLAITLTILGQAVLLWRADLVWYALIVVAACVAFVLGYEQPHLRRRFGREYEEYRRAVPGWWPRLRRH